MVAPTDLAFPAPVTPASLEPLAPSPGVPPALTVADADADADADVDAELTGGLENFFER